MLRRKFTDIVETNHLASAISAVLVAASSASLEEERDPCKSFKEIAVRAPGWRLRMSLSCSL